MHGLRRDRHRRRAQRTDRGGLLQRAGLRTLCLDAKLLRGRDGLDRRAFRRLPVRDRRLAAVPDLGRRSAANSAWTTLPTVDLDVMSVSLRGIGDEPLIYYTDPMKLLTHLSEVHGVEAVNGMAGLMAWSQAPTRALGRFDARHAPEDARRDVRLRDQRIRALRDQRPAVRLGHRRARPLPAGQGEARRAARHAGVPRRQHDLSRARDARHRRGAGLRVRRARRERACSSRS